MLLLYVIAMLSDEMIAYCFYASFDVIVELNFDIWYIDR